MNEEKSVLVRKACTLCYRFTQHLAFPLLLSGFFIWGLLHLGGFSLSWDEGVLLMTGRMVARGYALYTEVWYNYPPLHAFLLAVAFRVLGERVAVGRAMALAFSVVGLIGVAWVAGRTNRTSRLPSLAATILLLLSPPFLANSRVVLADLPAASLSTVAMGMALCYLHQGRGCWLAVAGLSLGLSVLFKPTAAFTAGSLLLVVWLRDRADLQGRRATYRMVEHMALLLGGMVCALGIGLLPVNFGSFWQQMMDTYWASKRVHVLDLEQNLHTVWAYLTWTEYGPPQYGFLAVVAFGALGLFRRCVQPTGWVLLAWLGLAWGALLSHAPLYNHLLISLLLPLAVVGGCGLGWLAELIRDWPRAPRVQRSLAIVGLATVLMYAVGLPGLWAADRAQAYAPDDDEDRHPLLAARELRALVPPDEFIVTDSLMLAFHLGRDVPPELVNTSSMRIRTNQLTPEQLIALTQAYRPRAIIFWEDRLMGLKEYAEWVDSNYCLLRTWGAEHRIYLQALKRCPSLNARLGDHFLLSGWTLAVQSVDPRVVSPGDAIVVSLRWRTLRRTTADYQVFLHLGEETVIAQQDGRPHHWQVEHPTFRWRQAADIVDTHVLTIPRDAPQGYYPLRLGMYDIVGKKRLPVTDARGQSLGTSLLLTRLRVGAPHFEVPDIPCPEEAALGDKIRFLGYDLPSAQVHPNESIDLTLYWKCLEEMATSYTVFTHIVDADGNIVGQRDSIPQGGELPTTAWVSGEVVVDPYQIPIATEAQPGPCQIEIGMYDVRTGQRLPVVASDGEPLPGDRIPLGEVHISN